VHSATRNGAVSGIVTIITARENYSRLAPMPLHTYPVWQPRVVVGCNWFDDLRAIHHVARARFSLAMSMPSNNIANSLAPAQPSQHRQQRCRGFCGFHQV
jgi:hypothetical protein